MSHPVNTDHKTKQFLKGMVAVQRHSASDPLTARSDCRLACFTPDQSSYADSGVMISALYCNIS